MMTIYIITTALSIALIYGLIVYKRQTKSDKNFIDRLRKDQDVASVRVQVVNEKINADRKVVSSRSLETEILIGYGFVVLTQPLLALYNKEICRDGVKGITWSIDIDRAAIAEDKLMEIEAVLPDDETTYTHLIFKGMTDREVNLIKGKLLLPQE
jgi:hypothetical protein